MPKKSVAGAPEFADGDHRLAGWQAAGLTLAVVSVSSMRGLGVLVGIVLLAPVILALTRLRAHAPSARSTADLVGGVLGARAGAFTGVLQVVAYILLAATVARGVGIAIASPLLDSSGSIETMLMSWWWPAGAVLAVVVAGVLAHVLPIRALASAAGVLAVAGVLIIFYLALAIIARVLSGTDPVFIGNDPLPPGIALASALILLALGLTGFEVSTVRNRQVRSVTSAAGIAIAATAACAVTVWFASRLGSTRVHPLDPSLFQYIVFDFYGDAGAQWLSAGTVAIEFAALVALTWAAAQVAGRLGRSTTGGMATLAVLGATEVVVIAFCRDWGGVAEKVAYAGPLLLLVVYVLVTEANSRISEDSTVAWWLRLLMPTVLIAAVLIPLLYNKFSAASLWPVAISAALVAVAFAVASAVCRRPV